MTRYGLRLVLVLILTLSVSVAFPPAPHHFIDGLVRDEYGNPLATGKAEIYLQTSSGVVIASSVVSGLSEGVNYRIAVPMDSGVTADLYKATALRPLVPFKIKVQIGTTTYLPIEMAGDYARLGKPGERTRINLTLGEDLDGDGLPDAWERALIAASGGSKTLDDIRPGDDFDGDGLRNLDEYIAGTYAFDNKDGFVLKLVPREGKAPALEFMTITRRAYSVYGSADFKEWTQLPFRLTSDPANSAPRLSYEASEVRVEQVELVPGQNSSAIQFYRLMVH